MASRIPLRRGSTLWEEIVAEFKKKLAELPYDIASRILKWLRAPADSAERRTIPVIDFASLGEFLPDSILFAPRPPNPFRFADGSTRPGFFLEHVPLPSFSVDHIQVPDHLVFPSDAWLTKEPQFADQAPRLGPILGCGPPLLPPPKPMPVTDVPRGLRWDLVAVGLTATAVVVTIALYARRRRALRQEAARRRAEEEARRRAEEEA
jgi:hypothetical protein